MPESNLLTVSEVADYLKLSKQSVRNAIRTGKLKSTYNGKPFLISKEQLREYIHNYEIVIEPDDHPRKSEEIPDIVALSFFSGAMGLDIGMEKAGIKPILACEFDKSCRKTIECNRPDIALIGDINNYSAEKIREMAKIPMDREIDVMFGGPPCQAFSTAGNRKGFEDERGNVFLTYLKLASELKPKILVIENVRGLMSTAYAPSPDEPNSTPIKGGALLYVMKIIRHMRYSISFNLYNAANFGAPQCRERFVIICRRDGIKAQYLYPTNSENGEYGLPKWKVLKDVLHGLNEKDMHHSEFPKDRLVYYRLLKEGQYWKNLPKEIQPIAMGNSYALPGGKTGFYRRLSFDKPSPTLVTNPTMPATDLCHPTELRPLSIEEYKRIQEFPDDWKIVGDLDSQYRQVGNAVPISLGYAIGRAVLNNLANKEVCPPEKFSFSRYLHTNDITFEEHMKSIMCDSDLDKKYTTSRQIHIRLPKNQTTFDHIQLYTK